MAGLLRALITLMRRRVCTVGSRAVRRYSESDSCGRLCFPPPVAGIVNYRSHPDMVGDMSHVTVNFDLSKIPFVRF